MSVHRPRPGTKSAFVFRETNYEGGEPHEFLLDLAEIDEQIERICAHAEFTAATLKPHLLRYLIWLKIRPAGWKVPDQDEPDVLAFDAWAREHRLPRPGDGLHVDKPPGWDTGATGSTIIYEFYTWVRASGFTTRRIAANEAEASDASRALAGELRAALAAYYYNNAADEIRISIPKKAAETYQPRFERRSSPSRQQILAVPVGQATANATDQAFRAFWGYRPSLLKQPSQGVIIIQSDETSGVWEELPKEAHNNSVISLAPRNRFFKARTWVNRWDMEGAQAIRNAFQKHSFDPPRIMMRERSPKKEISKSLPLVVSMGFGFTGRSITLLEKCTEWMGGDVFDDCGDALFLHERLEPNPPPDQVRFLGAPDHERRSNQRMPIRGFRRLLPAGFDPKNSGSAYMKKWLSDSDEEVQDYAIIFRYTEKFGQTQFLIGGFTERSTAIAATYLANEWERLSNLHFSEPKSLGDFLVVIAGPSNSHVDSLLDGWSEVLAVNPQILFEKSIECEWQARLGPAPA